MKHILAVQRKLADDVAALHWWQINKESERRAHRER
jgi:hypothetical protein